MAVIANMRTYVPAPAVLPRYGLFTVANGPLDLPRHAIAGGLEYETARCVLPTGLALNCETPPEKAFAGGFSLITGDPFMVRSSLTCGAVGMTDDRLRQMLMDRLKTGEEAVVERIFSEETFGQNPGLPGAEVVTPDCTTPDIVSAIGALEAAYYADFGMAGTLHVPMIAGSYLFQEHQLWRDGRVWRTAVGSAVSIGNYANESPGSEVADPGHAWIYMTGPVTVWRTNDADVFIPTMAESLNRATNEVTGQAEREYVVGFECGSYAVDATLCVVS